MSIIIPSNSDYRKAQDTGWSFSDDVLPNASFLIYLLVAVVL